MKTNQVMMTYHHQKIVGVCALQTGGDPEKAGIYCSNENLQQQGCMNVSMQRTLLSGQGSMRCRGTLGENFF